MTTENLAVLFTDMVGSTALASSMPPDSADELRREHYAILRQAVAETGGREVKNLGDGLMVVFTSTSAALSCAVAMQQGVERDNRARERSVGLRVGLSVGEVIGDDNDYFGDAVIEAVRLCAACEGGQILAADVVRTMAGRRSKHVCISVGPLALKGLPDPVETVEVAWEPIGGGPIDAAIPLPDRLLVRPRVGVVGRAVELSTVKDATKRVAEGEGREVVLVSGEAGLGKTTLVAEVARAAFDGGAYVLFGHCEEDLATPYQLFAEALGHYVMHAPEEDLIAHVSEHGSELGRLVPALGARLPELPASKAGDADTERFLLFAAVVGLLATVSRQQPVVVVLDDLQWADTASLQLLRHLIASDLPKRLLVLGTYRDSELSRSTPLMETLAALHRLEGVARIELAGLDASGVVAFMEAAAGHQLDDATVSLAHAVYRETDGNPFFVGELLRHLSETGAIYRDPNGRWIAGQSLDQATLPDSVREVIGARVGRLGDHARRVLSLAAAIGRDFDLDLLARASDTTEDELLDILDAAAAASLVREVANAPGRYSFGHALVQRTLYEDLGATRRARAHRKIAEALEVLCGDRTGARVGELARHWFNATQPIDLAKAIGYSRQAAEAALTALAPDEAAHYYVQALALSAQSDDTDPALTLDLAIGLGTAQRQTGDAAFHATLVEAARRAANLGYTDRLVAAALATHRGWYSSTGAIGADKIEVLEAAQDRLPTDHPDRALVLATLCSELAYASTLDRRQELAREALSIAEALDDEALIVRVLNLVHIPLRVPHLLPQTLRRTADALTRAERLGDQVQFIFAALWRADAAHGAGDIDAMDRSLELAAPLVVALHQPFLSWAYTLLLGARAQISGDTDRAEELANDAFKIATEGGEPDARNFLFGQRLVVQSQRGEASDLLPLIDSDAILTHSSTDLIEDPSTPGSANLTALLANAAAEVGRINDARRMLDSLACNNFQFPLNTSWTTGMVGAAGAAIAVGDPKYAMPLFDQLTPFVDQWAQAAPTAFGPFSRFLGGLATVLGRYDEADALLRRSAEATARAGAKFFAAQTDLLLGAMLAARDAPGDIGRARDLLMSAQAVAETHGYARVERQAAEARVALDARSN